MNQTNRTTNRRYTKPPPKNAYNHIKTVSQLYPDTWLSHEHLQGQIYNLTVTQARIEPLRNPRTNEYEPKIVLDLQEIDLRFPLNKTQAKALMEIAGHDHFKNWAGLIFQVSPGKTHNGQETITISPIPTNPQPAQAQQQTKPNPQPIKSSTDWLGDRAKAVQAMNTTTNGVAS